MNIFKEFKAFAIRGNVVDLAVGVVIGAAFGKIVSSLVNDVINPVLGILTGTVDFSDKELMIQSVLGEGEAITIKYGLFINTIIEFTIIAFAVFLVVRQINRWKRAEPAPEPTTYPCPHCTSVIAKTATRCPHCTSELKPVV